MKNERDVEFTPSPAMGATAGGVEFTPASGLGGTGGGEGAREQVAGAMDQAKETVQRMVGQAQERTTEQVHSTLDSQKHRAAESLGSMADSLRSTGRQLGAQEGLTQGAAPYVAQAADRVEDIAAYLRDADVGELLEDVEDLARRQPALFLGGAFVLGVLGARFLKSSRRNLVHPAVRERWSRHEMTSRVESPERDAVGRPHAPGYAPPSQRAGSDDKPAGPR